MEILSIKQLLNGYQKKQYSSNEVINYFLNSAIKTNKVLNHFITISNSTSTDLKNAIPVAYKDIFSTKNVLSTGASKILSNYVPPFNATVVSRLQDKNFVSIGKLNCDAFAHGASGENSDFGPTKNPYNTSLISGGSSSGSAAAVAALSCLVATATDTGGSIRNPASYCNVVGLKPTYGRVSRYGVFSMTSSTDSIGHITKTVWDSAYVLEQTAGVDYNDSTSSNKPVPKYTKNIDAIDIKNLKIGLPKEYFDNSVDKNIKNKVMESVNILKKLGAKVVDVSLPNTKYGVASYYIITPSEVSSNLARITGLRYGKTRENFGDEAVRRIMIGTFSLSSGYYDAYYAKAQKVRNALANDFKKVFETVDVLIAPVVPIMPPKIGEQVNDPLKNYLMDALTIPVNMAGLPALSVPSGFINNLPVGLQIIGPKFSEELLFKVGKKIEDNTEYYKILPKIK